MRKLFRARVPVTDRYKGFVVTLGQDIREDDAESIINAMRMIKGVVKVSPVEADLVDQIARARIEDEVRSAIDNSLAKVFDRKAGRS
jgi:hypothetical protein